MDKDAPGVRIRRTPRYMHTFVYEHPEIEFADVHVGPDQVLGEVGQGYELSKAWFLEERLMIAARTIGAAERALELASEWARERRTFASAWSSTSSSRRCWPTASSTSPPTAR